uniref:Secreted protein n=1 Tax=Triticum urartu TaxID=4572 RepID=A0A8R7TH29_TRIUA
MLLLMLSSVHLIWSWFSSCNSLGNSFSIRKVATFSSPSAQARGIIAISARGSSTHQPHPPQRQPSSKLNCRWSCWHYNRNPL